MVAVCKECGWQGPEAGLAYFRCPSCGSRNLKTDAPRMNQADALNPPEGARKGE